MSNLSIYLLLGLACLLSLNEHIAQISHNSSLMVILVIFILTRGLYLFSILEIIAIGIVLDIVLFFPLGCHSLILVLFYFSYFQIRELILASNFAMLLVAQCILVISYLIFQTLLYNLLEFSTSWSSIITQFITGIIILWILNLVSYNSAQIKL